MKNRPPPKGNWMTKSIALITIVAGGIYLASHFSQVLSSSGDSQSPAGQTARGARPGQAEEVLSRAFEQRQSNVQVEGAGIIERVLKDDNDGSRHQRFILRLASGQTILVAHNIDLADRIESLAEGDRIEFNGEYEWNPQGGVIHWTHHDPAGKHVAGWLKHKERIYQ